jgi:endonuclease YncB( thermonuclease family)
MRPVQWIGGALLAVVAAAASAQPVKVVAIQDGDTLTVLRGREQVRIRLTDIDAPEARQDFGTRSRESLAAICHAQQAELDERGQDR